MRTDTIIVSNTGSQMDVALHQVELVGAYKSLSHKNVLQLRLLAEEMMSMIRSITGETSGEFWIEDQDDVYQLHFLVDTRMNSSKREKLLATATSGKNESARGIMGSLRDFFDRSGDEDVVAYSSPLLSAGINDSSSDILHDVEWSMVQYRNDVYENKMRKDAAAIAAWDQLEQSVVAHVADEVKVSIRGRNVEMIIFKKLA